MNHLVGEHMHSFGTVLAQFRKKGRLSQLTLSLDANVSTRHISFLETGRARPSRAMIEKLAAALSLCPKDKQTLLLAAGFWTADVPGATEATHTPNSLDTIVAIECAPDAKAAALTAGDALAKIGLSHFFTGVMTIVPGQAKPSVSKRQLDHAPLGWLTHYHSRRFADYDPMLYATAQRHLSFFWSDILNASHRHDRRISTMLDEAKNFHVTEGFVMPLRRFDGSIHAVSCMAERCDVRDPSVRAQANAVSMALLRQMELHTGLGLTV